MRPNRSVSSGLIFSKHSDHFSIANEIVKLRLFETSFNFRKLAGFSSN